MKPSRRILGPLTALVAIQVVWLLLVILWTTWFFGRNRELSELADRYRNELLLRSTGWFDLFQGLVLLTLLLAGAYTLFLFWKRQSRLYQQQREFITRITHELKSPLASIQLHLETIRLRRPAPDRLDAFVETMLADTQRLHLQIENLLLAARMEQRLRPSKRREIDLSAFICRYLEDNRDQLPPGTRLDTDIEPDLQAAIDPEELGTALRNLLENSVLYSADLAEISVQLKRKGRYAQLVIKDKGYGIAPEHQKKIFNRFYRVETAGDRIRGTGLGLYIVQTVVRESGGTITAESEGAGKGTTITLNLPILEKK